MKHIVFPSVKQFKDLRDITFSKDINSLPVDLCYFILQSNNFEDIAEAIQLLEPKRLNAILDLHVWQKDLINSERYFEILSAASINPAAFKKLLFCTEPNLLMYLLLTGLNFKILDERTEFFDEKDAFTIDNGMTWIWFTTTDPSMLILLKNAIDVMLSSENYLLNLIINFGDRTKTELMEEAYKEKEKLLSTFEIPDEELRKELLEGTPLPINYSHAETSLEFIDSHFSPLEKIITKIDRENLIKLVKLLVYAIGIELNLDITDIEKLYEIEEFTLATINIGIQKYIAAGKNIEEFTDTLSLKDAFKVGWFDVIYYHKKFKKLKSDSFSQELRVVIESVQNFPPKLPKFFSSFGLISYKDQITYDTSLEPISNLSQLSALKKLLSEAKLF